MKFYIGMSMILYSILFASIMNAEQIVYKGQVGQDKFLNEEIFKNKRNGVFIDIGAHDGVTFSNTYFFEKELGWTGICFEPLANVFEILVRNRNCICINQCVADKDGQVAFIQATGGDGVLAVTDNPINMLSGILDTYDERHLARLNVEIEMKGGKYTINYMPCCILNNQLKKYFFTHIDLLSIDTEGNELQILKTIDFDEFDIDIICVENNYGDQKIRDFLKTKGYNCIKVLTQDEIYAKETM